jgi:hypothetical protein
MRILLASLIAANVLPMTATFQRVLNLNVDKIVEVLLMAPIEQVQKLQD